MSHFDLTGKVAVVTGSTRGIGLAIARAIAEAGGRVAISSRKQDECDAIAEEIEAQFKGSRAIGIAANLADRASLQNLVDGSRSRLGPIDILVCNAASSAHYGSMLNIPEEKLRRVLDNNVVANNSLIQMAAPDMIERRAGAIIVVSSIAGLQGTDLIGAYAVTKAADHQLVRNMAVELGRHNVTVNAISPGTIRTVFARALYEDPELEAELRRATPLGRIGEPDDVAGAAVFLASRAGAYVTGQSLVVDGGFTVGRPTL